MWNVWVCYAAQCRDTRCFPACALVSLTNVPLCCPLQEAWPGASARSRCEPLEQQPYVLHVYVKIPRRGSAACYDVWMRTACAMLL